MQDVAADDGAMDFNDDDGDTVSAFTMADINRACTELYSAMGKGATKADIHDALVEVAGVSRPADVPEEGYARVIAAIGALADDYRDGRRKLSARK